MSNTLSNKHLTIHEAISDAIIRNAQGIDDNDTALMTTAFHPDAIQDMTAFSFLDPHFGITNDREAIIAMASATVGRMDTTHMLSNFRTQITSDDKTTAHLTCYALAQHWRPGQGRSYAFGDRMLMNNRYEGELALDKEDGLWKLKTLTIRPIWTEGDFGVFDMGSWEIIEGAVRGSLNRKE